MGVKTKISLEEINTFFKTSKLTATLSGKSDTVYILDDKYILKLFEDSSLESLNEELKLLELCKDLPLAKVIKKPFILKNKPAMIYEKCSGEILKKTTQKNIKQITMFLKNFHFLTKEKTSLNKKVFEKDIFFKNIQKTKNEEFLKIFDSLDIKLKNDGIIHGDLFIDNATFIDDNLSCVFDFKDSCNGDFIFDLAVLALSWCKNDEEYEIVLDTYGLEISLEKFKTYIKYASLYYCVLRYLKNQDYENLLKRCKEI